MLFLDQITRVLAIGAHPDDIELGAGGLIARLVAQRPVEVTFLVLTPGIRTDMPKLPSEIKNRREEASRAGAILGVHSVHVLDFTDSELHLKGHEIISHIERILKDADDRDAPFDLLLTHGRGDTHSDHRQAFESTIAAAKAFHGSVLLYQSPSTIPNEFRPTLFVGLDSSSLDQKVRALEAHVSQGQPYMDREQVEVLASAWARFHHMQGQQLEAFEVYKAFWL